MKDGQSYFDINQYIRVLKLARQPTEEEFFKVALISGIGILLVGLLGFTIFALMSFIPV